MILSIELLRSWQINLIRVLINERFTALHNETKPYTLAYTTNYFFEVKDDTIFYLIWFYNFQMVFFAPWYTSSIGLLVSLMYHVSGRLAVLCNRTKNLSVKDFQNEQAVRMVFRELAQTHLEISEYPFSFPIFVAVLPTKKLIAFFSLWVFRRLRDNDRIFQIVLRVRTFTQRTMISYGTICPSSAKSSW